MCDVTTSALAAELVQRMSRKGSKTDYTANAALDTPKNKTVDVCASNISKQYDAFL